MSERLQPALWGGLLIGVLSALPFISLGNCCCCLWVIGGGMLATYLRQQNTPFQVTAAEGALVGMIAGAIGGAVATLLSIPLQMMLGPFQQQIIDRIIAGNPDIPPDFRDMMGRAATQGAFRVFEAIFTVCIFTVFGLLGGLLGAAVFKKNAPPPPPPPGTVDVLPPE
jgi:hypothetical protein